MKKFLIMSVMLMASVCFAMAQQNQASIKFDKMIHNFGTFSEDQPTQKCVFTFTNVGTAPLIINRRQAVAHHTGSGKLRMHHSFVHQGSYQAGREGRDKGDIQRHRSVPRPLQEDYHRAHQRRNRADTPLHRGRDERE